MNTTQPFTENINQDIERLIHNQKSLLDVMPAMVLIIKGHDSLEYMNPSAIRFFGNLLEGESGNRKYSAEETINSLLLLVRKAHTLKNGGQRLEEKINGHHIEYGLAPFIGYRGDNDLFWLFIHDLTEEKNHIEELSLFHNSIETILSHKISELNESERMRQSLSQELNHLKDHLMKKQPTEGTMVGTSKALRELRDMVFQVAKSDATILITGESGTGKELIANMLRETSNRCDKPFLKINCNTINDSLLESDLFGYEKGAFTGADSKRKGKFEVVDGGTIFLDEIGDVSPRMQAALLRVLQDGELIRVGGNSPVKVDVRIIAATNADLAKAVQAGTFRLDLYYRLNIINISIPPLRQRKEDIVDLVTHFIRRYRQAFKKDINFLPQSVIDRLLQHEWPGNVRELENVIQRAVLMAKGNIITENELLFDVPAEDQQGASTTSYLQRLEGQSLKGMIAELEREIINYSLEKHKGNVAQATNELQIGKTAFYEKMKRYEIIPKELK
jgi:transcriptional regulator with PAS, ATPase and Fis domain